MIHANFTAELHCQYGQAVIADTSFSDHTFTSLDEDGWLITEGARDHWATADKFKRVAFDFHFIKQAGKHTFYVITCSQHWDYAGARLEQNTNGWLGLYGTHVAGRVLDALNPMNLVRSQDYWKIETLEPWDGDVASVESVPFYLRDKNGHRVAQTAPSGPNLSFQHFMNASALEGEILVFKLRNLQLD
jgi:hypothetical protein